MKDAVSLASSCLGCKMPRCQIGCPIHNQIPLILSCVKKGDLDEAREILSLTNPFPEFTSRLCDCARQCQGHCVKGIKAEPVSIQAIERELSDLPKNWKAGEEIGKKVAIIGAGIAALSAALTLREKGISVSIFEKEDFVGGAIATGIPGYRFDKSYLEKAKSDLEKIGVVFHLGKAIDKEGLSNLKQEYDAVILSVGASKENFAGLSASKGYESALSFLRKINIENRGDEYKNVKHAIVWGGGNVAMDAARTLKRIIDDVKVIYRRSEKEMPANFDEIALAKEEGVEFLFLQNVTSLIKGNDDAICGIKAIKMELGEPDASGRASFHEIGGSEFDLPCDLLIAALGQKVDLNVFGDIRVTENHKSNLDNVYLSGDTFLGAKTVAACIEDGKEVALEIIKDIL